MICEDGWNDDGADYAVNPFARLADAAPDLVVSINASPSDIGKREQRHQVFGAACRRHGLPLLYVNQIGGQDQVVFDGASFAVERRRGVVLRGAALRRGRDARCASTTAASLAATARALPPVAADGPVDDGVLPRADRAGPARLRAALRLHARRWSARRAASTAR